MSEYEELLRSLLVERFRPTIDPDWTPPERTHDPAGDRAAASTRYRSRGPADQRVKTETSERGL